MKNKVNLEMLGLSKCSKDKVDAIAVPYLFSVMRDDNVLVVEGKTLKAMNELKSFYSEKDSNLKFHIQETMGKVKTVSALFDRYLLCRILEFFKCEDEIDVQVELTFADNSAISLETTNWRIMLAPRMRA